MSASPRDYRCLSCNAEPGSPCVRPSGHAIPFGDFHAGRKAMYDFHYPPVEQGTGGAKRPEIPADSDPVVYGRLF